jgi:hypothetical protein
MSKIPKLEKHELAYLNEGVEPKHCECKQCLEKIKGQDNINFFNVEDLKEFWKIIKIIFFCLIGVAFILIPLLLCIMHNEYYSLLFFISAPLGIGLIFQTFKHYEILF